MESSPNPVLEAIRQLILGGWPFEIVIITSDATPQEIPSELVAAFPEAMKLEIDPQKLIDFDFPGEATLSMTLAFHRILGPGQRRTLRVRSSRIAQVSFLGDWVPVPPGSAREKPQVDESNVDKTAALPSGFRLLKGGAQ